MELELSKSRLRPWLPGDEESLVLHANNRNVWRNLRDAFPHPYAFVCEGTSEFTQSLL